MESQGNDIKRDLDLNRVCDGNLMKLVTSHMQAIGVAKEYIFFPLLSAVSSFLGSSSVKINDDWQESCALWTGVVARRGSKRSATLERFSNAIMDMTNQQVGHEMYVTMDDELTPEHLSKHDKHLALHEDFSSSKILQNKDARDLAKNLLDRKSMRSKTANKSLSIFSFLPPQDAMSLLDDQNIDVSSRFIVGYPKCSMYKAEDIKSPMPSNTPSLSQIFEVLCTVHKEPMLYSFNQQAKSAFDAYFNVLQEGLVRFDQDERKYCILSKASGQVARLSVIMASLRQALKAVVYRETVSPANWNVEITVEDIDVAKIIMDYAIDIRFTLLSRISTFKSPRMLPRAGNLSESGAGQIILQSDEGKPSMKRPRIAAADPGHGTGMINDSVSDIQRVLNPIRLQPKYANHPSNSPCQPGMTFETGSILGTQIQNNKQVLPALQAPALAPSFFSSAYDDGEGCLLPRRSGNFLHLESLEDDDLPGFNEEQQRFIRRFSHKIKKLLEYHGESRISPSCCAQRHLMPPIPKTEMVRYETQTRYPVQAAKEYLTMVADLGFGIIETTWHASNNRKSLIFQKHPYDKLNSCQRQLLNRLHVDLDTYMYVFSPHIDVHPAQSMPDSAQHGISANVSSSTPGVFSSPYPFFQQQHINIQPDPSSLAQLREAFRDQLEDSNGSSTLTSDASLPQQFPKSEPHDDDFV